MKSYREMTESVLEKAGTEIKKRERRRKNGMLIIASGLCFALLLTVLGMGMEQPTPMLPGEQPGLSADVTGVPQSTLPGEQPGLSVDVTDAPQQTQQAKVKITYLSSTKGQTVQKPMSANISLPLSAMVRVRDIRGLSREEVAKVREEEKAFADDVLSFGNAYVTMGDYQNAIISYTSRGTITMEFDDTTTILGMDFETTGVGSVVLCSTNSRPNPDGVPEGFYWPSVRELDMDWNLSQKTYDAIEKDPTFPLETIRDTLTATFHYADATTETYIFDFTVDAEGQVFVTQREVSTSAA